MESSKARTVAGMKSRRDDAKEMRLPLLQLLYKDSSDTMLSIGRQVVVNASRLVCPILIDPPYLDRIPQWIGLDREIFPLKALIITAEARALEAQMKA